MTEEIKGILEEIKEKNEVYEECSEDGIIENEYYKSHLLLNYITNLQNENEELLKKLEDVSLDEANIRADILLEQQDYKQRNEKAVEYIENISKEEVGVVAKAVLLNILKGDIEEDK